MKFSIIIIAALMMVTVHCSADNYQRPTTSSYDQPSKFSAYGETVTSYGKAKPSYGEQRKEMPEESIE